MIKIEGDYDEFIDVETLVEYDYNANNGAGSNVLKVKIKGGSTLINMQSEIQKLTNHVESLLSDHKEEMRLRKEHKALAELYDQYQVVLQLVKKSDKALTEVNK